MCSSLAWIILVPEPALHLLNGLILFFLERRVGEPCQSSGTRSMERRPVKPEPPAARFFSSEAPVWRNKINNGSSDDE